VLRLCDVEDLKVHFPLRGSAAWVRTLRDGTPPVVRAVDGVSLGIEAGATLGLVGESGCGKSTVARALVRLLRPTGGHIRFEGAELTALSDEDFNKVRPHLQMVFQDPAASLNPRLSVRRMVEEPLRLHTTLDAGERKARTESVLEEVGLGAELADRRHNGIIERGALCTSGFQIQLGKVQTLDQPNLAIEYQKERLVILAQDFVEELQARAIH
jgi:ABC-type oligopeptide transport system ATPase subunit